MRGEKGADRQTLARTVCLDADAGERIMLVLKTVWFLLLSSGLVGVWRVA